MATKYPDGIDNTTSLPYITNGTSPMVAEDVNRLRDAVVAVETELGIDPSGTFTSVGARLQANEQAISEYARSQFLVLSHDGYISQERVFAPSANFSAVDGGAGFDYNLDLAPVVGIGTLSPATDYSLTLDGNGSSRIGGVVLRNAGADALFIGNPSAGNALDVEIRNPNSGSINIESAGEIGIQGSGLAAVFAGTVDIQGASATLDTTGSLSIGATSSGVEIGKAGADTEILGDLSVDENIDVPNGTITFSSDLSIGSYPAGYTGFGPPLPLPYSVLNSTSGIIANTQGEELLLTTNLSGIFGLNTDNWTLLGLDTGRTVATNKYGGAGGPTSSATMFSTQAAFGVVGTMVLGSADPDDGDGAAIEAGENLAITALGDTALLLANNSSGTATIKVGAIDGSGPTGTDSWNTKYGNSSPHVTKIVDFVHNGSAQVQVATGGGEAAPEYSFSGATNTGIFQGAPGSLSISADGLEVFRAINASSAREVVIGPDEEDSSLDSVLMATSRPSGGTADSDGSSLYLRAGTGLGTGDGGSIVMQVAPSAALSGQSQNTFSDILTADAGSVASPRQLVIDASAVTIGGPTANNAIVDIGAQESASGITKQINIGNGGLSGSTTDINIGSAVVGTSNITIGDLNANVEINGSSIVASGLTASTNMSLFNQATIATRTKTITIGNGALSGSTTNINIGSSVAGASNIVIGDSDATTSMSGALVTLSGTAASNSALSLFNQASSSSVTKSIDIGNGGLAGSITNINLASSVSGSSSIVIGSSSSSVTIGGSVAISNGLSDEYLLGGLRVVASQAARESIPVARQKPGMLVLQSSDNSLWRLNAIGNPGVWRKLAILSGAASSAEMLFDAIRPLDGGTGIDSPSMRWLGHITKAPTGDVKSTILSGGELVPDMFSQLPDYSAGATLRAGTCLFANGSSLSFGDIGPIDLTSAASYIGGVLPASFPANIYLFLSSGEELWADTSPPTARGTPASGGTGYAYVGMLRVKSSAISGTYYNIWGDFSVSHCGNGIRYVKFDTEDTVLDGTAFGPIALASGGSSTQTVGPSSTPYALFPTADKIEMIYTAILSPIATGSPAILNLTARCNGARFAISHADVPVGTTPSDRRVDMIASVPNRDELCKMRLTLSMIGGAGTRNVFGEGRLIGITENVNHTLHALQQEFNTTFV